jgi:hypothetical protein
MSEDLDGLYSNGIPGLLYEDELDLRTNDLVEKQSALDTAIINAPYDINQEYQKSKMDTGVKVDLAQTNSEIAEGRANSMANSLAEVARVDEPDLIQALIPVARAWAKPAYTSVFDVVIGENTGQNPVSHLDANIGRTIQRWYAESYDPKGEWSLGGIGNAVKDVADLLFFPDEPLQMRNVMLSLKDEIGLDSSMVSDYLGESLVKLGESWNLLPEDQQAALFPVIVEAIEESTGNAIERETMLLQLQNPSRLRNYVDRIFGDVLGGTGDVLTVSKLFKNASMASAAAKIEQKGRELNPIKVVNEGGGGTTAASMNKAAKEDPEIQEALNVSEATVINNELPFVSLRENTVGATDLSRAAALNAIDEQDDALLVQTVRELNEKTLRAEVLSAEEAELAMKSPAFRAEIDSIAKALNDERNLDIADVEVLRAPEGSGADLILRYKTPRTYEKPGETVDVEYYWKTDDINTFKAREDTGPKNQGVVSSILERYLASPEVTMDRHLKGWAAQMNLTENQTVSILGLFKPQYIETFKGLNKQENVMFNALLEEQDRLGRLFTKEEILAGVDTKLGRVSPADVSKLEERYASFSNIVKQSFAIANDTERRRLLRDNYKTFTFVEESEEGLKAATRVHGKVLEPEQVPNAARIWVPAEERSVLKSSDRFKELKDTHVILRPDERLRTGRGGTGRQEYVLARREDLGAPEMYPIRDIAGFVPRLPVAEGSYVRILDAATVQSTDIRKLVENPQVDLKQQSDVWMTHAKASSRLPAEDYVKTDEFKLALRAQFEKLGWSEDEIATALRDTSGKYWFIDNDKFRAGDGTIAMRGNVGTRRATHDIYDITGEGNEPVAKALGRMLASVARGSAVDDFINFNQRRWLETAKRAGPEGRSALTNPKSSFADAQIDETVVPKTSSMYWNLEKMHRDIQQLSALPALGQQLIHKAGATAANSMWKATPALKALGLNGQKKDKFVGWLTRWGQTDPQGAAMSLTFHTFLGMANPRQYFLQLSQGLAAYGTNLDVAPRAFQLSVMLNLLDVRKADGTTIGGKLSRSQTKALARANGMSASDLKGLQDSWKKLGHKEGIVLNADWANLVNGASLNPSAGKRLLDIGITPYTAGEVGQRQIAFTVAAERYLKNNPDLSWTAISKSREHLSAIQELMTQFSFIMSKGNKAPWQHNFGIATQFRQHMAKSMEALGLMPGTGGFWKAGTKWTPTQRLSLLASQGAVYGATGVAFGDVLVDTFVSAAKEVAGEEHAMNVTPQPGGPGYIFLDDGILGLMQEYTLGTRYDVGSSFGLTTMIQDTVKAAADMNGTLDETLLGPLAGAFGDRWISHGLPALTGILNVAVRPEEMTDTEKRIFLHHVASIFTSSKNAWNAVQAHQFGFWADKNGFMLADLDEDAKEFFGVKADVLGRGLLGLQSDQLGDVYRRKELRKITETKMNDVATAVVSELLNSLPQREELDYETLLQWQSRISYIVNNFDDDEEVRGKLRMLINSQFNREYNAELVEPQEGTFTRGATTAQDQ